MDDHKLLNMLQYRRAAGSKGEEAFIQEFIDVVPGMRVDNFGNRWLIVGDGSPTTMFSAHTDTVHSGPGVRQKVFFDPHTGEAFISGKTAKDSKRRQVLGADDAAGCYVLLELIAEQVPGLYVFHREEEIGGRGSHHFASADPAKCIESVDRCIAFDRKGFTSVITAQGMERCCSDDFGRALAHRLGMEWKLDDTGVFTDSANYTHIIPECTNLSVGYQSEHTKHETVNVYFVDELVDKLLDIDWDNLPTKRNPNICEYVDDYRYGGNASFGWPNVKMQDTGVQPTTWDHYGMTFDSWDHAYDYIRREPEKAADLLLAYCGDPGRKEGAN